MKLTLEEATRMMAENDDSLDLRGCTGLTALPEGLTVGGSLYLRGCTGLTALPEGLTVGGWLDLRGCTGIKDKGRERAKVKKLRDGDYEPGRYLFADGILTPVKSARKVGEYTFYAGKIKGKNVVSDGEHYAHCATLREGIADIAFKRAKNRGAQQYRGLTVGTEMSVEEAKTMYRVITGACRAGTEAFVAGLGDTLKERYTIREMIELTRGQYGAGTFERFWEED